MSIHSLLSQGPTLSLEFFPPKSPKSAEVLDSTFQALRGYQPVFVAVTFGGGGATRDDTAAVAEGFAQQLPTMAHLTCIGHQRAEIDDLLDTYQQTGVRDILALGGDPRPEGDGPSDFSYAADLVEHIKARGGFDVGVAAHPEVHPRSPNRGVDRQRLADKLALADFAVTQFFFEASHWLQLVSELADLGVSKPVIPGIIPITNLGQVERFANMAGATVPPWLTQRLTDCANADDVAALGVSLAADLAAELLDLGAPGIHLYTLNQTGPAASLLQRLGRVAEAESALC